MIIAESSFGLLTKFRKEKKCKLTLNVFSLLLSDTLNKYYIGSCQDIQKRLQDHLNSRSKFTKVVKDWELKYYETFETRSDAMKRELQIKKMKSSKYIESLIETKG